MAERLRIWTFGGDDPETWRQAKAARARAEKVAEMYERLMNVPPPTEGKEETHEH